jgi:hypothetical protein
MLVEVLVVRIEELTEELVLSTKFPKFMLVAVKSLREALLTNVRITKF